MSKKKQTHKKAPTPKKSVLSNHPAWFVNSRLHSAIIFLFCFVLYANTINHDFTQDDAIVIYDNEFTTQGFAGIPSIMKYDTFRGFFKVEGKDKLVSGGRYRPLTLVMFAIGVDLFGLDSKPMIGHIMNIFWYGLTCVMLYILLLKMLSGKKENTRAYFIALVATLIFAAHPLHTEVVANIKGRDEIITLLGALATAYFSLRSWKEKKPLLNIVAAIIFFITLFSKENAITFLGVIPLMFFCFTKASIKDIALRVAPLVVAAVAFLAIRASVIGGGLGEPPIELMNNPFVKIENNQYVHFSASERLGTIFYTLLKYIQLLVFPHPLTHDYYPRHIGMMNIQSPMSLLSIIAHLGMLAYALIRLPKKDVISFGILFYLGTLFIVSNLLFPIGTNMAERLMFMPSVGFCIVVAVLLYRLAKMLNKQSSTLAFNKLVPYLGVGVFLALAFGTKTVLRNPVWKNNFTLFTTDAKVSLNSAKLQNSVGGELIAQATKKTPPDLAMIQEAVPHLEQAIKIHPNYKNAFLLLGNAHNYLKDYKKSIQNYEQAIRLDQNYVDAIQNLAVSYRDNKQFDKAVEQLQKVNAIAPGKININENIAFTYEEAGKHYGTQNQHQQALNAFQKAMNFGTDKSKYLYFMGLAYGNLNNPQKAIETMEQALQKADKNENKGYILRSLGDIYKTIDPAKSQQYYQQAQNIQK